MSALFSLKLFSSLVCRLIIGKLGIHFVFSVNTIANCPSHLILCEWFRARPLIRGNYFFDLVSRFMLNFVELVVLLHQCHNLFMICSMFLFIRSTLPSANSLERWFGEPVRSAIISTDVRTPYVLLYSLICCC